LGNGEYEDVDIDAIYESESEGSVLEGTAPASVAVAAPAVGLLSPPCRRVHAASTTGAGSGRQRRFFRCGLPFRLPFSPVRQERRTRVHETNAITQAWSQCASRGI
jgi:hypothetical protein